MNCCLLAEFFSTMYVVPLCMSHDKEETDGRTSMLLDGNSEHVAHAWRKIGLLGEEKKTGLGCSRSNRMP